MGIVLDVILLVALVGYVVSGARKGLAHSLGSMIGVVAGAIAAFFLVPLIGGLIAEQLWRVLASIGLIVVLIGLGHGIGARVGDAIARAFRRSPLRVIDRVLGAIANGIVAALMFSLVAASVAPLGVPLVSAAIGQSVVLRSIADATPAPVEGFLARVRSTAVRDTIPSIVETIGGVTAPPALPEVDTGTGALAAAAASVVRVSGNASACAQSQSGTGFVVAPGRVLTNAHVVAGVIEPVVETPDGGALAARVVYFDPTGDIAVLAAGDLDEPALPLADTLAAGDTAVYDGYPFGGPFVTGPAKVLSVSTERVDDIYGEATDEREIYALAADIQQGNSGGPLLTADGEVAGVVFAKSATTANVGFAMTPSEFGPVIADAADLTDRVDSGSCSRE
jgi:S1-C subfamily serine protease